MSLAEEKRIEAYFLNTRDKEQTITEVPFAKTTIGDLEIVIVAEHRQTVSAHGVSEDEIEKHLEREGLIRVPKAKERPRPDFKPIEVAGKPISEMIIEERR